MQNADMQNVDMQKAKRLAYPIRRPATVRSTVAVLMLLAGVGVACSNITPVAPFDPPITDSQQLYVRLAFDHPAVLMSTSAAYATVQVTASPRNALGGVINGLPTPTYRSTDTTGVTITPAGLVIAHTATAGVTVIAELTVGTIRHVDSMFVVVTDETDPRMLQSLSLDPVPPDSAIWPWQPAQTTGVIVAGLVGVLPREQLAAFATDVVGSPLSGLPIAYTSLDPDIVTVDRQTGVATVIRPGVARMVAQTMAYGVARADTVTYTMTLPVTFDADVQVDALGALAFTTPVPEGGLQGAVVRDIRIVPHGIIFWKNMATDILGGDTVDVIFDDSTDVVAPPTSICTNFFVSLSTSPCGNGNVFIPPAMAVFGDGVFQPLSTLRIRQFPKPGIYPYHSARLGVRGRVLVANDF